MIDAPHPEVCQCGKALTQCKEFGLNARPTYWTCTNWECADNTMYLR